MKVIAIMLVVFVVLWFTKKFWTKLVVAFFSKKTVKHSLIDNKQIFSPVGTIRTIIVAIDIKEIGDGTVELSLAKVKNKELQ